MGKLLIGAEQVTDFTAAHTDIAGRHIDGGANLIVEAGHEGLAETHDFRVAFTMGIKITAALAATDGQAGKRVFENLFKAEELQHAQIHCRMEAEAALVRSEGGVELNAIAAVNLNITLVVLPGHAEHNSAFGLGDSFEDTVFLVLGIRLENRAESAKNFSDCLNEFRLIAVTMLEFFDDAIGVRHGGAASWI